MACTGTCLCSRYRCPCFELTREEAVFRNYLGDSGLLLDLDGRLLPHRLFQSHQFGGPHLRVLLHSAGGDLSLHRHILREALHWGPLQPPSILGVCFILYAMVVYPLLGLAFGHSYPRAPMFGVAPCPTTIFTFGILLWSTKSVPAYVLVIPFLWSIVGMSAAVSLRVPQDYGIAIAGVLGSAMILIQNRKAKAMAQQPAPLQM